MEECGDLVVVEANMNEFPIGVPSRGLDLLGLHEELEELLTNDASIYDDNDADERMFDSMLTAVMTPDIVSVVFSLVYVGSIPFLCVGLYRQIYLAKSVSLFASSLIRIISSVNQAPEEWAVMGDSAGDTVRQINDQTVAHKAKDVGVLFAVGPLHSLNGMLSFILFYELYLCTCRMEARKQNILQFVKKILIVIIISFPLHAIEILSVFISDNWWYDLMPMLDPAALLTNLICTGAVIYFGIQILIALRKSDEFRKANFQKNEGKGKTNQLKLFIIVAMVAQVVTSCYRLASMIALPILLNKITDCDNNFGSSGDFFTNVVEVKRCDGLIIFTSYMSVYLKTKIDSVIEILAIVVLMSRKKCTS